MSDFEYEPSVVSGLAGRFEAWFADARTTCAKVKAVGGHPHYVSQVAPDSLGWRLTYLPLIASKKDVAA